jgi:hypothetical protein
LQKTLSVISAAFSDTTTQPSCDRIPDRVGKKKKKLAGKTRKECGGDKI